MNKIHLYKIKAISMFAIYKKKYLFAVWLILTVSMAIIYGMIQSIYTPVFQLDGAYQTASGLYRINNGFVPGRDFFPYLGLVITWFLYPVFVISGSNMGASVFSAYFMVFMGTIFSIFTFLYFSKRNNTTSAMLLSLLGAFFVISFYDALNISLLERVTPGNSLKPLRSLVSPLAFILLFLCVTRIKNMKLEIILVSAICGISLCWSNDFGYPTALMCGVTYIFLLSKRRELKITTLLIFGFFCLLWYLVFSTILTMGNTLSMLKYNIDIALDQGWYFNSGRPGGTAYSVGQLFSNFLIPAIGYKLLALPAIILIYFKTKNVKHLFLFAIGLSLLLGGIIPVVGGHVEYGYAGAYNFWFYCVFLSCIANLASYGLRKYNIIPDALKSNGFQVICCCLLGVVVLYNAMNMFKKASYVASTNPNLFFSDKLGGYLSVAWKEYFNLNLGSANIQEDYWGLYSAYHSTFSNAPTDSVIHALGTKRTLFNNSLRNSDVVITASPGGAGQWLDWLLSANWDFYSYVLKNYRLEKRFITTDLWVKEKQTEWVKEKCIVTNGEVSLPEAKPGYYEVSIRYDYSSVRGRGFYMIKNNLNKPADANGFISINKNSDHFNFPVLVESLTTESKTLPTKVVGNVSQLIISSCTANKISDPFSAWFQEAGSDVILKLPNTTDSNWLNGIARDYPGLFLRTESGLRVNAGDEIIFVNGEKRVVSTVSQTDKFINIYLEGEKLDGAVIGYPNTIKIKNNLTSN